MGQLLNETMGYRLGCVTTTPPAITQHKPNHPYSPCQHILGCTSRKSLLSHQKTYQDPDFQVILSPSSLCLFSLTSTVLTVPATISRLAHMTETFHIIKGILKIVPQTQHQSGQYLSPRYPSPRQKDIHINSKDHLALNLGSSPCRTRGHPGNHQSRHQSGQRSSTQQQLTGSRRTEKSKN